MKFAPWMFLSLSVPILVGCATVENNYTPRTEQVSFPGLNEIRTVTLGEPMLRQGTATTTRGVLLSQENNIRGFTLSSGFYPQTGEDSEFVFTGYESRRTRDGFGYVTLGILQGGLYPVGLRFSKNEQQSCAIVPNIYGITQALCDTEYSYQFTERPFLSVNDFQQTLIYSGRIGDRVRISYRESSGDMARPAFANEAEYDLSVSDTIACRGARLRVITANNESIQYEVISNFNVAN